MLFCSILLHIALVWNLTVSPKAHELKGWSPGWHCWKELEPLGEGAYGEVLTAGLLNRTVGLQPLPSLFYLLGHQVSSLLHHVLSTMAI